MGRIGVRAGVSTSIRIVWIGYVALSVGACNAQTIVRGLLYARSMRSRSGGAGEVGDLVSWVPPPPTPGAEEISAVRSSFRLYL